MTTQTKQYKLLKELPALIIGTIFTEFHSGYYSEHENDNFFNNLTSHQVENNPDWFELIVEKPKSVMKYDNGAVVDGLMYGDLYYAVYLNDVVKLEWTSDREDFNHLYFHNVFLTKEEAEKALLQRQTYDCLYKKIREIDERNGFVCDWSDNNEYKYYVFWDHREKKLYKAFDWDDQNQGTTYMSEQAAKYLCSDAVTKAGQKLFCGIFD